MFTGFTDDTVQFFLDLKFHNNSEYFHLEHDRYIRTVQAPFYELIEALGPVMRRIDPLMEIRPYKCLSRIHRDTRFSRDKSPYRDHLWLLFRRAGEPREKSLFYYFEFGPSRLAWGMGFWGENREVMDQFRRRFTANPKGTQALLEDLLLERRGLAPGGTVFRRITVPSVIPMHLQHWYCAKELYVSKVNPPFPLAFSPELLPELTKDFQALSPLYALLRGMMDQIDNTD